GSAGRVTGFPQALFDVSDGELTEVEDRCGQNGVRARFHRRWEVLDPARTTRGDDGHVHPGAYLADQFQVEAGLGAVGVHRVEHDLPRPQLRSEERRVGTG